MMLVGLTGGIGSGKSTVAAMLKDLGATIVDADAISRATTAAGGSAIPAICSSFGVDFVDQNGALDRVKMRALVFSDSNAKTKLETITHPLIKLEMQRQIESAKAANSSFVVLDLPLLAESTGFNGWRSHLDRVVVVDCSEATQIDRVMVRNHMTEVQIRAVIENQASRSERLKIADVVIFNDGLRFSDLKAAVKAAIIDQ